MEKREVFGAEESRRWRRTPANFHSHSVVCEVKGHCEKVKDKTTSTKWFCCCFWFRPRWPLGAGLNRFYCSLNAKVIFLCKRKKKEATFEFCLNYSHLNHTTTKGTETHFWGFICRSQKLQTDFQQIWKHLSQTLILTNQLSWKPWKPWNKNKEKRYIIAHIKNIIISKQLKTNSEKKWVSSC